MKRLLTFLAVAVALALALAWWWPSAPPPAPVADEAPAVARAPRLGAAPVGGRVSGSVLRDGRGVGGARVTLKGAATAFATAADDGQFLFAGVPSGAVYLSAATAHEASEVLGPFLLEPGGAVEGVVLRLTEAVGVGGVVLDAITRRPIAEAAVVTPAEVLRTDRDGRFRLAAARGQTWLDVSAPGYLDRSEWTSLATARAGARLEVTLMPASTVDGLVTEAGRAVANASVWGELIQGGRRGERTATALTDAQGRFSLRTAAGLVRLAAATPRGVRIAGPDVRVAIGQTISGVVLEAGEVSSAAGVVTRDGAPLPGASLSAVEPNTEEVAATVVSGPDGRFRFDALRAGRFLVQVRAGAFAALAGPFEQRGDGVPWAIAVSSGGAVTGRVEPAAAGVQVRCRASGWAGPPMLTVTDEQGRFRFEGLSGDYAALDAEGAAGSATARVTVGDEVVLRLGRGAVVVHLSDGAGAPVSDGVLLCRSEDTGAVRRHLVLAPDGVHRLELPVGVWALSLEAPGKGRSAAARVEVTAAGAEVFLALEPSFALRGVVRDGQSHLPIEGARVVISGEGGINRYTSVLTTDARGEFSAGFAPRRGGLSVTRAGYHPAWLGLVDLSGAAEVMLQPNPAVAQDEPHFEGVGMVLEVVGPRVRVAEVNEGSPAERAGVLRGDFIVAVDGAPVALPIDRVTMRIRGSTGTSVRITFERAGQAFELTLWRRTLYF